MPTPRAFASAEVVFGGFSVFVKLYSAVTERSLPLSQAHAGCGGSLRQQHVCCEDGAVVDRAAIVKAFQHPSGAVVHFAEEEMRALDAPRTDALEVLQFVPRGTVDPLLFAKAYLLGPDDERGVDGFATLVDVLTDTSSAAVGRLYVRGRERPAMVEPRDPRGLVLRELHFPADVRSADEVDVPAPVPDRTTFRLWRECVEKRRTPSFDATAFADSYPQRLLEAADRKLRAGDQALAPARLAEVARKRLAKAKGTPKARSTPPAVVEPLVAPVPERTEPPSERIKRS